MADSVRRTESTAAPSGFGTDLLGQLVTNARPGPSFEADGEPITLPDEPPVRLIAYYLPQFHPIPENDRAWGEGFTEWTNVTRGLPRYEGHYQPRLPDALGFYDLRLVDNLRKQAALGRRHGIHGFCFHYYWFGGHKVLDAPINNLLANPDIDLPFCINWANENWTRTWDGHDRAILLQQYYSPEDDLAFAAAVVPIMKDPRYIRINGRPLLMLYRPSQLPDITATVARWRKYFVENGVGDPYLVMPQVFDAIDPRPYGMDAAAGFPPHRFGFDLPPLEGAVRKLDPNFQGRILSYDAMAARTEREPDPEYVLFPGVCPGFDNDARRPGRGVSFVGAEPQKYGEWLGSACAKAAERPEKDERLVFINAWNEWAEGAHLEPDRHFGHAFLRETARTVARSADLSPPEPTRESAAAPPVAKGGVVDGLASLLEKIARRLRRLSSAH